MSSLNSLTNGMGKMKSIYRMSDSQANWAQTDPSQPDYIKNKEGAQEVRPIYVNGEEFLDANVESGPLNLVGGKNVTLSTDGNSIVISAKASGGGEGGGCDCPELLEGEGIDIVDNAYGQRTVSLEHGSITDEHVKSISMSKIVQDSTTKIVLNGGNANG